MYSIFSGCENCLQLLASVIFIADLQPIRIYFEYTLNAHVFSLNVPFSIIVSFFLFAYIPCCNCDC